MGKKYELISSDKPGFYRIKALKSFGLIRKGEIGGYVQSEKNLSHKGFCWIYNDAIVQDDVRILDSACIFGNAIITGKVIIRNHVIIDNFACINGHVTITDNVYIYGHAYIDGYACISNQAQIGGNVRIYGDAVICERAIVHDKVEISGKSHIGGTALLHGEITIRGNTVINSSKDYIVFKNWWSSGRYFTWTRSNDMWSVGCFYGTGKKLIKKAYQDSEISGREYKRIVDYVESIKPYLND